MDHRLADQRVKPRGTTRARWPRRIALGIFGLLVAVVLSEGLLRLPAVQRRLPDPGLGMRQQDLELKIARMDTLAGRRVPCLVIGSSAVRQGFDPAAFSEGYASQTGSPLECFNFGVNAFTASGTGPLAEVLVRRYQPVLLIYPTVPSDFSPHTDEIAPDLDTPSPWLRAQRGEFSLQGWLIEESMLARYTSAIPRWRAPDREGRATERRFLDATLTDFGYLPRDRVFNASEPPTRDTYAIGFALLGSGYTPSAEDLAGLAQITNLRSPEMQVILAELPFPAASKVMFDGGPAGYDTYLAALRSAALESGVPFWEQPAYALIPPDGWFDHIHLNQIGAAAFSRWLGERTGNAVRLGLIDDPLANR